MTFDKAPVTAPRRIKTLFINRSYWPDVEATGQLLTELCEDLATRFDVRVIAGQPNANPADESFARHGADRRHGVAINRVWHTPFAKSALPGRALNYVSFLLTATARTLCGPRADVVVVESDPPLLCFTGALGKLCRRSKLIIYLQDIHPDIGVAIGKLRPTWALRTVRRLMFWCYRYADGVVTLSEDMRATLVAGGVPAERISCIPNWIDAAAVTPVKSGNPFRRQHRLDDKFVVMYSGNIGLTQDFTPLLAAASELQARSDVEFVFIGNGVQRASLEAAAASRGLTNARFLNYQPKERLAESLSAADLQIVLLDPRLIGLLLPSKIYGVLAAGTACLVLSERRGDLAQLVIDGDLGEVCDPADSAAVAAAIRWAADHPAETAARGRRGRAIALESFDRTASVAKFAEVIAAIDANVPPPTFAASPAEAMPRTTTGAVPAAASTTPPLPRTAPPLLYAPGEEAPAAC